MNPWKERLELDRSRDAKALSLQQFLKIKKGDMVTYIGPTQMGFVNGEEYKVFKVGVDTKGLPFVTISGGKKLGGLLKRIEDPKQIK